MAPSVASAAHGRIKSVLPEIAGCARPAALRSGRRREMVAPDAEVRDAESEAIEVRGPPPRDWSSGSGGGLLARLPPRAFSLSASQARGHTPSRSEMKRGLFPLRAAE